MKVLRDKIYVRVLPREEKTKGGIYLPDDIEEKVCKGMVLAIGDGHLSTTGVTTPLCVNINDTVVFRKHYGIQVDDDHVILREDEILAIMEPIIN